jgi:hypothetical protein
MNPENILHFIIPTMPLYRCTKAVSAIFMVFIISFKKKSESRIGNPG